MSVGNFSCRWESGNGASFRFHVPRGRAASAHVRLVVFGSSFMGPGESRSLWRHRASTGRKGHVAASQPSDGRRYFAGDFSAKRKSTWKRFSWGLLEKRTTMSEPIISVSGLRGIVGETLTPKWPALCRGVCRACRAGRSSSDAIAGPRARCSRWRSMPACKPWAGHHRRRHRRHAHRRRPGAGVPGGRRHRNHRQP